MWRDEINASRKEKSIFINNIKLESKSKRKNTKNQKPPLVTIKNCFIGNSKAVTKYFKNKNSFEEHKMSEVFSFDCFLHFGSGF